MLSRARGTVDRTVQRPAMIAFDPNLVMDAGNANATALEQSAATAFLRSLSIRPDVVVCKLMLVPA